MKKKSLLKTLHVLSACSWLGASASVVLLQYLRGWSENMQELSVLNLHFAILDFALIIPGAMGSLLTGFWICKTTGWGFIRYRWVIVKWIGTLSGITAGTALLGPWQMQLVKLSGMQVDALSPGEGYAQIRILFTLVGSLQVFLLILIIAISVRKPWGKRSPAQKEGRITGQRTGVIA